MSDQDWEMTKPPKTVVIERQVTEEEYQRHVAKMRKLGLSPQDVAPLVSKGTDGRPMANDTIIADGTPIVTIPPRASWQGLSASKKKLSVTRLARPFTIGEKVEAKRHANAMNRFSEQLEKWEKFRSVAAGVTKRNIHDLVITRAEEYRELVELRDLLAQSAPEETVSGGHSWFHSLRGDGSRFVQVGNMFSGLYIPVKMQKENIDQEIKRNPWLRDMVKHRKERHGVAGGPRTWRNDEYLLAILQRYRKAMRNLAPGKLEFDETLEITCKALRPPVEEEAISFEKRQSSIKINHEESDSESTLHRIAEEVRSSTHASRGPHLDAFPPKLEFYISLEEIKTAKLVLLNSGTTSLMYELHEVPVEQGYEVSTNPRDPTKHFRCHNPKGRILPGSSAIIVFSFTSQTAGAFYCSYSVHTKPRLLHPIAPFALHGLCVTEDPFVDARHQLEKTWSAKQIERGFKELVDDVVRKVTASPYPDVDLKDPVREQLVFETSNPSLYYSADLMKQFRDLAELLHDLNPSEASEATVQPEIPTRGFRPPCVIETQDEEREWNLDLCDLWTQANATNNHLLQRDLKLLERKARKRFVENVPSYQLCEELLLETVELLPPLWVEARTACELPDRPKWPIEDPEEDLQKGDDEHEDAAMEAVVASFGQKLGDALEEYAGMATAATIMDVLDGPACSLEHVQLLRSRQTMDDVDCAERIVFYEPDVSALDIAGAMQTRLQGLIDILESGPVAVVVVTTPDVTQKVLEIVKDIQDTPVELAPPELIADAINMWEDGSSSLVFVADLQDCPQQNGLFTAQGESMTWTDRDVWFDVHFPHAYDYYVLDNFEGLFATKTLLHTLGFSPPVRLMQTVLGPYITSELNRVYKDILQFECVGEPEAADSEAKLEMFSLAEEENSDPDVKDAAKKNIVVEPKLVTFGGTGQGTLTDITIFRSLLTVDAGPMLLLPPFVHQVVTEVFEGSSSLIRDYFAELCTTRDVFCYGLTRAHFRYTRAPSGIAIDPVTCKFIIEEREGRAQDATSDAPPEDNEGAAADQHDEPPVSPREDQDDTEEKQVDDEHTDATTLPDLLTDLLKRAGGILAVGLGVTLEFLDTVQVRVDNAPGEDEEEEEEKEDEEDEEELEGEEDEDGEKREKRVVEEKLGPFQFLAAVGESADVVDTAGYADVWSALSNATTALRLLSQQPVAALALNPRKAKT